MFPIDLSAGLMLESHHEMSYQCLSNSLFLNEIFMSTARKNVVSESGVAVDDCDPACIQVFVDGWVTVADSDFFVWSICDHRLWRPHFMLPVRPGGLCKRRLDGTLPVSY